MKKLFNIYNLMKVIGFVLLGLAIYGLVLTFTGFGDFESNNFMIGGFLFSFGLFLAIPSLVFGFSRATARLRARTALHIHTENRDTLAQLANTKAEIASGAIKTTAQAVREGFTGGTMFCKHCGAQIDADSKFCKSCGKEL